MLSEEARTGERVRVRADNRSTTQRGLAGTIEKGWGDPDSIALDLLLDDGSKQLFWHYEPEDDHAE